jgi:hypothetical protein
MAYTALRRLGRDARCDRACRMIMQKYDRTPQIRLPRMIAQPFMVVGHSAAMSAPLGVDRLIGARILVYANR